MHFPSHLKIESSQANALAIQRDTSLLSKEESFEATHQKSATASSLPNREQIPGTGIENNGKNAPGSLSYNFNNVPLHPQTSLIIQPKLSINVPGDEYEQEADKAADKIMRMVNPEHIKTKTSPVNVINRKCATCSNEHEMKNNEDGKETKEPLQRIVIQRKFTKSEGEKEKGLQRKESGNKTPRVPTAVTEVLRSSGQPLNNTTRSFMEQRLGYNFSKVRIHDDQLSHKSSSSIQALAYTHRNHVVFGAGQYKPETDSGKHLLAHELVHVVQQNGDTIFRKEASTATSGTQVQQAEYIVEDYDVPTGGQMRKSNFLSLLNEEVCRTVDLALHGTPHSSDNCPYIRRAFSRHSNNTPFELEQLLRRYEPSTILATNAQALIQMVLVRVAVAVESWKRTGDLSGVPEEVSDQVRDHRTETEGAVSGAEVSFKANSGGAHATQSPMSVMQRLGKGNTIDSTTRSKMENAFGSSFSDVEIHTDSQASLLSNNMNSRAFAVGNHIAFGNGEYQPGTLIGDALMAHELAHVVQQKNTSNKISSASINKNSNDSLEYDADNSAVYAMISLHGKSKGLPKDIIKKALPRLKTGLRLQSCKTSSSAPLISTTRGVDQRVGIGRGPDVTLPDASLAREVGYELDPSSRPAPVPPPPSVPAGAPPPPPQRIPWDGATSATGAASARTAMKAELFAAFDAYLTYFRPTVVKALSLNHVPVSSTAASGVTPASTGVVDIANQVRQVLETRYAVSMDAAASSPAQVADRAVLQESGPGQNLFDISSEPDRSTLTGSSDLAPGVAWWMFENDTPGAAGAAGSRRFSTEILAAHHYSTQDPGAKEFRSDVARAYALAATLSAPTNTRQLVDYRMTQWSETGTKGISLQSGFDPASNHNAELMRRWQIFSTATHESLHLRSHPAFEAADQGRATMKEGFTEMFTVSTLNTDILPRVRSGGVEPLRRIVEGAMSTPSPNANIISNRRSPTQYVPHREAAERIRDGGTPPGGGTAHVGIGEAGVRAAFFEGHVEYLGLNTTGSSLGALPVAGTPVQIRIPSGITDLNDLASRSGVSRVTIIAENPGITNTLPPTAVLSGCREHWVVSGETRANIAAQNGLSEADLVRANPDIPVNSTTNAWPTLTAGQKVLIPVH